MTVGTKVHQVLASLEGATATLKTFALETEDKNAKGQYSELAQQVDSVCDGLRQRVDYVEEQEPQYKVYEQAQQQQ